MTSFHVVKLAFNKQENVVPLNVHPLYVKKKIAVAQWVFKLNSVLASADSLD